HARSNVLHGIARDVGRPRQLIQKLNRDIELADGAQGAGHTPNLLTGLAGLAAGEPGRQNRYRLTQAPGCHPGLVDARIVPPEGRGNVPVERTGKPLKQHRRYTGGTTVHGRMTTVHTFSLSRVRKYISAV